MRLMIVVIVLVAGLGVCQASRAAGGGADFHVAATGRDDGPGTRDKPFASLGRARDAVRAKIAGGLTADVTVLVHGGTYRLHEPLVLTAADSGTDKHAVTYAAAPGEAVTISGGRRITGFPARDAASTTSPVTRPRRWIARYERGSAWRSGRRGRLRGSARDSWPCC